MVTGVGWVEQITREPVAPYAGSITQKRRVVNNLQDVLWKFKGFVICSFWVMCDSDVVEGTVKTHL